VVHDGANPYPGARACLESLKAAGKRVVMLSNSGRSNAANEALMASMGFARPLYDAFIAAGEDARNAIAGRTTPFHARLGRRCLAFTRDGERRLLDGLGLTFVDRVEDADFVAVIGIDSPRRNLADYEHELRAASERNLPMVCANPDLVRFHGGRLVDAPGVLAHRYEAIGGEVFWHGKPHPPIYDSCLAQMGGIVRSRIVAVGDSLDHDVAGAASVGLPCAFVAGGVYAEALGISRGEMPAPQALASLLSRAPARPAFVVPAFTW
jgi:HAD superfamily hydrolase (TIGR01459 family)